ncbi:unnamed protein product [Hymenolepis diminuta]|uniref:Uncharacterized protein n=1 Tax=Hymenolepis diminuta TaxID=6216 RepID=A0A564Y0C2_HYMDI|nr:unnamed protein product [Hymenolepis diminuta]
MNDDHCAFPLSVYFQGRVFVVGFKECVNTMEMLDVAVGGHWTILILLGPHPETRLTVGSMVRVGSDLFVKDDNSGDTYSIDLKIASELPRLKWGQREIIPFGELTTVPLK